MDRAGLADLVARAFPLDRWVTDPHLAGAPLGFMFTDGALEAAETALVEPATQFCLLAVEGEAVRGTAIGWIDRAMLRYAAKRIGVLWSLAVAPGARGRGLGTALARAARDWMQDRDCVEMAVSTDGQNPANRLYQRLGMTRHHELVTWIQALPVDEG